MKERLRKIYELSVRGVDGERETAQRLLKNLLEKHGLSLSDITDTVPEYNEAKLALIVWGQPKRDNEAL